MSYTWNCCVPRYWTAFDPVNHIFLCKFNHSDILKTNMFNDKDTDQVNLILDLINNQTVDLILRKVPGLKRYDNAIQRRQTTLKKNRKKRYSNR